MILFWLIVGVLIGLILIPAFLIGAVLLLGLVILFPIWLPVAVIVGALLLIIGVVALLIPK